MKQGTPTVDVIIPTYKRAEFLSRAIDSVLQQSYKAVNVIVVDDNNDKDSFRACTEKIMLKYLDNPRVTYLRHQANKNGAAARNTGIQYSTADFIGFLDDDDFYLPRKIESQLQVLEKKDDSWGGCCCFHVRRFKNYAYTKFSFDNSSTGNFSYDFLSGKMSTPSSTLLLRSKVIKELLFDESFIRHQDLELLMRFYRKYKMAINPSYDVYMQIEGFRNYPSSKNAYEIKSRFLQTFRIDIEAMSAKQQQDVFKYQWFEVACLCLKDRDFKTAGELFKTFILKKGNRSVSDYFRISFFLLNGYIPALKPLSAFILSKTKYQQFSHKILFF